LWIKRAVDKAFLTECILRSGFTTSSGLEEVVWVKFAARPQVCAALCEISKQAVCLIVETDAVNKVQ
jgi:hypothetical protein